MLAIFLQKYRYSRFYKARILSPETLFFHTSYRSVGTTNIRGGGQKSTHKVG